MTTGIFPQFMHSGQTGAPQMDGADGSEGQILQVLDKCLSAEGFGEQTATEVTLETDRVAIKFGTIHKFEYLQFINISGATDAELNGKHRIVRSELNTIWIEKGSITSAAGTILVSIPGLDWENMFGTTDNLKRAYRSKDPSSTRTVLYLDCELRGTGYGSNPLKKAVFSACEDMTVLGEQINSYTEYWNEDYIDGALHWIQAMQYSRSGSTPTGARPWILWGDGKLFYFAVGHNSYSWWNRRAIYMFGDMPRVSQADKFNCIFSATQIGWPDDNSTIYDGGYRNFDSYMNTTDTRGRYFIKTVNGLGRLDNYDSYANIAKPEGCSGNGGLSGADPLTFGLYFSDILIKRNSGNIPTGNLPYLKAIANNIEYLGQSQDVKHHNDHLLFLTSGRNESGSYARYMAIDLMEQRKADGV